MSWTETTRFGLEEAVELALEAGVTRKEIEAEVRHILDVAESENGDST